MSFYIIKDWAGNFCFCSSDRVKKSAFKTFEEAEEFLSEALGDNYDTDRQEYYIEEVQS